MPKLTYNCPLCDKPLRLKEELRFTDSKLFSYECGHVFASEVHKPDASKLDFTSKDGSGKQARHYQETGIEFIIESDFNAIIADQMRLGKTPTALLALANAYKDRTPALIIVKGANLWQWVREYKTWTSILPDGIFPIISGSKSWIPPGFKSYIISMDTFSRPAVIEKLKKIPFKLIIVDEAHSFKNSESNRAQALVDFVSFLNTGEINKTLHFTCIRCDNEWVEQAKQKFDKRIGHVALSKSTKCPKCGQYCYQQQQHNENEDGKFYCINEPCTCGKCPKKPVEPQKPCGLILLTGTPILNRADEYFVPLNLVAPEKFSSLEQFRHTWLDQDSKGRWSRVKRHYHDSFKETIKPYLLRREKEDVFKELPAINRIYTLIEPDKELYAKQYNVILDRMEGVLAEKANPTYWDMKDELMELRRICGMMKIMWTADYLETCALESSDKYAIGVHHKSVRDVLNIKLGGEKNCFKLSGENNAENKDWIMRNWKSSPQQFLIINMLAGGVGMDFHECDNVVILERQWNAEMERQFEFRFYNPDLAIKNTSLTVEYILLKDTFEQTWYKMLEEKKRNVDPLVYNNFDISKSDFISFNDLAESAVAGRL